jgi:hypothetical protein
MKWFLILLAILFIIGLAVMKDKAHDTSTTVLEAVQP